MSYLDESSYSIFKMEKPILLQDIPLYKEHQYLIENVKESDNVTTFTLHLQENNSKENVIFKEIINNELVVFEKVKYNVSTHNIYILNNKYIMFNKVGTTILRNLLSNTIFNTKVENPYFNIKSLLEKVTAKYNDKCILQLSYELNKRKIETVTEMQRDIENICKSKNLDIFFASDKENFSFLFFVNETYNTFSIKDKIKFKDIIDYLCIIN